MTEGVKLIGVRVELVGIAMLLGCNLVLPVGVFVQPIGVAMLLGCNLVLIVGVLVLHRCALVLLVRQIFLSLGKVKAIGRLFQKSLGRFFKDNFFNLHMGPVG